MKRIDEILCPVDLSECSSHALDHALALARRHDARVTVIEVCWAGLPPIAFPEAAVMPVGPVLPGEDLDRLAEELRLFAARSNAVGVRMDTIVREGAVVPAVLEEAAARNVDLIVVGTHGRSGFDRFILGSVTDKILRKATCAVMTVPPAAEMLAPTVVTKTIVCAIDFSPSSLKSLASALTIAQESQAKVVLLHVHDWPTDNAFAPGLEVDTATHRRQVQEKAREELRLTVPDDARNWCEIEEVTAVGRPHEEIVRVAHEHRADLIAMGVHGRSSMGAALFGSTTNQVVRHAKCPVLTVRG